MLSFCVRVLIDRLSRAFFGLRFRLLLLVLLTCAPLVALTLHTASQERRRAVAAWRERAEKMTQLAQREETDLIGQTRQLLLAVSESSAMRSGNREVCQQSLEHVFASYPSYANLGLADTNGDLVASAVPVAEPGNQAGRAPLRSATTRPGLTTASRWSRLAVQFSTRRTTCRPSSLRLWSWTGRGAPAPNSPRKCLKRRRGPKSTSRGRSSCAIPYPDRPPAGLFQTARW